MISKLTKICKYFLSQTSNYELANLPWCRWLDGGATTTLRWILAVMNSDQVDWKELDLKDSMDFDIWRIRWIRYLDRSKIGAMQIRWHLESSFSCMNYRSDDGKTSVSVGFYSCLGRLQSLSSTCLAWNLLETCRIPVLNVSLDAQSEALTFSGSLWETPLGKRSSNLFMLGVFGYSERATSSWVFQKQFWRCWLNFGRKVTSRLRFAKIFQGKYGHPHENVHCNLEL